MKKSVLSLLLLSITFTSAVLFLGLDLLASSTRGMPIQSGVASGNYLHTRSLRINDMKSLPVPKTNEDYAFLQSINTECCVVIGKFTKGYREIVLYMDKDVDGKVDYVVHWFVDKKMYKYESEPDKYCPPEKFKKMKADIIMGARGELNPNPEGTQFLERLFENSANIRKYGLGYRVVGLAPDDHTVERVTYYFADHTIRGVDLTFEVKYKNLQLVRESPIINFGVYCKNSQDKFLIETVKKLMKDAQQYSSKNK